MQRERDGDEMRSCARVKRHTHTRTRDEKRLNERLEGEDGRSSRKERREKLHDAMCGQTLLSSCVAPADADIAILVLGPATSVSTTRCLPERRATDSHGWILGSSEGRPPRLSRERAPLALAMPHHQSGSIHPLLLVAHSGLPHGTARQCRQQTKLWLRCCSSTLQTANTYE